MTTGGILIDRVRARVNADDRLSREAGSLVLAALCDDETLQERLAGETTRPLGAAGRPESAPTAPAATG